VAGMTRKELNLAIFEGTADRVLWQPRLETWYWHHKRAGTLPDRFKHLEYLEFYDELGCSVRYAASVGVVAYDDPPDVEYFQRDPDPTYHIDGIRLPEGELRTVSRNVWQDGKLVNRRICEFPVKGPEDLRVLTAYIERKHYRADPEAFRQAAERVGHRAEPTVMLNSAGFTELIKVWCGLEGTFYLLADHPAEVEAYLEACDRRDDRQIEAALSLPCRIFNLGDHATNEFTPPPILERYMLPRWQRISRRMTEHGRFVHTHWDGNSRHMLPYLRQTGLHGVEALTPEPMGDMSLEMIKQAVGDELVVLDLLPAIHFLAGYSSAEMIDFAKRVIDMFAPRLILGVSDEISQVGQIEKIEAISELVDRICGLAQ